MKQKSDQNQISKKGICPACNDRNGRFIYEKSNCDIYHCENCDLVYVFPMPDSTEDIYGEDYFSGGGEGHGYSDYEADKIATQRVFEKFLERIQYYNVSTDQPTLLDVGAANGFFVELASEYGFRSKGLEISVHAVSQGVKLGRDLVQGTLESCDLPPDSFDVITMFDLFEHVPNPQQQLEVAGKLLKSDGLLVLNMPDRGSVLARVLKQRWHLVIPPEHLLYFTQSSFITLSKRYGFVPLEAKRYVKTFPLGYTSATLARYIGLPNWLNPTPVIQRTWLRHIRFPIPTMDNFFMILRKSSDGKKL